MHCRQKAPLKGLFLQLFEGINHWSLVPLERLALAGGPGPSDDQNRAISTTPNPTHPVYNKMVGREGIGCWYLHLFYTRGPFFNTPGL